MFCFCFVDLRRVYSMLPFSLDCPFFNWPLGILYHLSWTIKLLIGDCYSYINLAGVFCQRQWAFLLEPTILLFWSTFSLFVWSRNENKETNEGNPDRLFYIPLYRIARNHGYFCSWIFISQIASCMTSANKRWTIFGKRWLNERWWKLVSIFFQ